ncbi:MAG: 3-phosphoshikimate 1-carboxyvinyltransferase [Acidimicrobiales bacterium]
MSDARSHDWLSRDGLILVPAGPVEGTVIAPSSKSVTNRLLVIASLAEGSSVLTGVLASEDTEAMVQGLRALGVQIERNSERAMVVGTSGRLAAGEMTVDAGLSGTTLRFLSAVALLAKGTVVLDGQEPLRRRPIAPLLDALRSVGAAVSTDGGRPPIRISGGSLRGGRVRVNASASSQFGTALLLVGPCAAQDLTVEVEGLREFGYVRLTTETMVRWGASVTEEDPGLFRVSGRSPYTARTESVEHDASAAAHLYALAVATGGSVTVANAFDTLQPDGRMLEVLTAMGANVLRGPGGTTVERPGELIGIDVDLAAMPDQVPTVAALGALACGDTVVRGVEIVRGHESDRIHAMATELGRLGARVDETPDGLVVHGGAPLHGSTVDTHRDHRLAMALTAVGAAIPGVQIGDPGCVAKTYPRFFDDVARLGVGIR